MLYACLLFKSVLFWFDPRCWSSFFLQKVCYPVIKQMPKRHFEMTEALVCVKRTIRIVFKKVGVFTGTAFVHDFFAKKKPIQKCFTNDAIYITYCQHNAAHWRQTYCTMAQVPHTSNVNYSLKWCLLYARWIMAAQIDECRTSSFVHCLSLLPNKFIFFYLLKIILKLQLMVECVDI